MYCPKCATANGDDVKFCRSCGANLSLVPQAMTGQLPESRPTRRHGKHAREVGHQANLSRGITQLIMGLGFLMAGVAIFFSGGRGWWWAMLFPAFSLIGKGVADIVTSKTAMSLPHGPTQTPMPPVRNTGELPPQQINNPLPPPSVTEGTTRHLDPVRDRYEENR